MMNLKMNNYAWVNLATDPHLPPHLPTSHRPIPPPPPHLPPIQPSTERMLNQFDYDESLFCIPAVRGLSKAGGSRWRSKVFCGQMDQERGT